MPTTLAHAAAKQDSSPKSYARENSTQISRASSPAYVLPPALQDALPLCAQRCLATYIGLEYQCSQNDFHCLCDRYSMRGYTIGELAYICVAEYCANPSIAQDFTAYNIYTHAAANDRQPDDVENALWRSAYNQTYYKQKLTNNKTIDDEDLAAHFYVINEKYKLVQRDNYTILSYHVYKQLDVEHRNDYRVCILQSDEAGMTRKHMHSTGLTGAQAAGVSVAALAVVVLAIVGIYLCVRFRRRKLKAAQEPRSSYDFVDEAPPRFSPYGQGQADTRGSLESGKGEMAELPDEKHLTRVPGPGMRMSYDAYMGQYAPGPNGKPPTQMPPNESTRAVIPAAPPTRPTPAQIRGLPNSPAPSAATAMTEFEEDRPPVPPLPVPVKKPLPKSPAFGLAVHYPSPRSLDRQTQWPLPVEVQNPQRTRQPSLSLAIPQQLHRDPKISAIDSFPLPPAAKPVPPPPVAPALSRSDARDSNGSVLEYYASPQAGYTSSPDTAGTSPVRRRKTASSSLSIAQRSGSSRTGRVTSVSSDTSFESVGTDEPTPPDEEEKQLTPVLESPIAGIRYPKVPRSSNQAVARSPKSKTSPRFPASQGLPSNPRPTQRNMTAGLTQPKQLPIQQARYLPKTPERKATDASTLSGSTLAAKRRGDSVAQDLERRLYVAGSVRNPSSERTLYDNAQQAVRHDSPLKGYGKVATGGRLRPALAGHDGLGFDIHHSTPKQADRRPDNAKWEPKLTPERRGDDLYLSVGLATPQTDHFRR